MKKQSGRTGLFDIASSSSSSSSVATGSSRLLNPFLMPPTLPDQTRMSEAAVSTWDSSDLDHGLAYTSHILPKAPDSDDSSDVGVMVSGARKRKRFTAKTTSPDALARPIPRTPPHQISNEAKALHPTPSNWNTSVLVNTPITPLPSPSQQHIANSSSKESKPNAALETILVNTEDAQMRLESPEDSEALSSPTREPSKSNEAVYVLIPVPAISKSSLRRKAIPKSLTVDAGDSILIPKGSIARSAAASLGSVVVGQKLLVPKSVTSEVLVATEADSDSELIPIPGLGESSSLRMAVPKVLSQKSSPYGRKGKGAAKKTFQEFPDALESVELPLKENIKVQKKAPYVSRNRKPRDRDVTLVLEEAVEALTQRKSVEEARRREEEAHRLGSLGAYHAELKRLVEIKPISAQPFTVSTGIEPGTPYKRRRRQSATADDKVNFAASSSWYPDALLANPTTNTWIPSSTLPMAMDIQSWTPYPGASAASTASHLDTLLHSAGQGTLTASQDLMSSSEDVVSSRQDAVSSTHEPENDVEMAQTPKSKKKAKSSGLDLLAFAAGWDVENSPEDENANEGSPRKMPRKGTHSAQAQQHLSSDESDGNCLLLSEDEVGVDVAFSPHILERLAPYSSQNRIHLDNATTHPESFLDLLQAADAFVPETSGGSGSNPGQIRTDRNRRPLVQVDVSAATESREKTLMSSIKRKTDNVVLEDGIGALKMHQSRRMSLSRFRMLDTVSASGPSGSSPSDSDFDDGYLENSASDAGPLHIESEDSSATNSWIVNSSPPSVRRSQRLGLKNRFLDVR